MPPKTEKPVLRVSDVQPIKEELQAFRRALAWIVAEHHGGTLEVPMHAVLDEDLELNIEHVPYTDVITLKGTRRG